jgi:uncharacterized protein DUF6624
MMSPGRIIGFLLVTAGVVRPARVTAQSTTADSIATACMERDTSTAWQRSAQAWSNEAGARWTNGALREELLVLGDSDQAVRNGRSFADSISNPAFVRRMDVRDSIDAAALTRIIARYGWPTRRMVGPRGADAAFLIAQHNASLQHTALRLMRALPRSQVSQANLAMLADRVLVSEGKAQRYATQLKFSADGKRMTFDPIDDVAHLDARRSAAGLPPLTSYLCLMRVMYGREVADPRTGTP